MRNPDGFLQDRIHPWDEDGTRRWEDPVLQASLDVAWYAHVERLRTAPRKAEAVRETFADHPAAGQFPSPAEASASAGANRPCRRASSALDSYQY